MTPEANYDHHQNYKFCTGFAQNTYAKQPAFEGQMC